MGTKKTPQPSAKKTPTAAPGAAKPQKTFRIINGKNFKKLEGGVSLNADLLKRATELCQFLIDHQMVTDSVVFTQGVRAPATAHLWSTSWNIRQGKVPLANLQALKDGKDKDGNRWYDAEWEKDLPRKDGKLAKDGMAKLWKKIKDNSKTHYDSNAVAAEGYKKTDERIKPNVHPVRSNHIFGNAMDVSISWKRGATFTLPGAKDKKQYKIVDGKTSDQAANRLVAHFGLSRPVKSEKWHFQLGTTAAVNASPANATPGHPGEKNPHP